MCLRRRLQSFKKKKIKRRSEIYIISRVVKRLVCKRSLYYIMLDRQISCRFLSGYLEETTANKTKQTRKYETLPVLVLFLSLFCVVFVFYITDKREYRFAPEE